MAVLPAVQDSGDFGLQAGKHKYAIELVAEIGRDSIHLRLKYQDAFLSEKQAHDVASTTKRAIILCLQSTLEDTVGNANMISERNKADLASWHSGTFPLATGFVHEVVRQRCFTDAAALAICAWDGELSYAELDDLSDRLAVQLVEKGARPGVFVPVCFEKSKWAIVASLGVLKAGAAFVPLDPSTPKERLENVLRHVEAEFVLASCDHANLFTATMMHCIVLSDVTIKQFPKPNMSISIPLRGSDPAYVLFTSGSTGTPKACLVDHSAFAGVSTHGVGMRMGPNSRVYQFASHAFGMALIDIYCALTLGATVCVPSEAERTGSLAQSMTRMQTTWAILTPSIIQSICPDDLPHLQTLVTAGEPLPRELMSLWAQRVHLVQGYGLTEWAGICAASEPLSPADSPGNVGRLPTSRMWLVDPEDPSRLVPVGAVGEMLLEGPCLAREYLKQPDETSMSFISPPSWRFEYPGPFPNRLYRSGDLMRYCDDGTCIYVGRKGTQVKIRGQRVELAEVEYNVRKSFPTTQNVIAELIVPRDDERPRLTVFLLLQSTNPLPANPDQHDSFLAPPSEAFRAYAETVRAALAAVLPRYMVPDLYIPLTRVPLTPTGKRSRRDLRRIGSEKTLAELTSYIHVQQVALMPRSSQEILLQGIFAQVLKRDPSTISVDDSFFHIGGDSIAGMQVSALCRKKGINISMQDLFRYRTIAALAPHVPVVDGMLVCDDAAIDNISPKNETMTQSYDHETFALSIPQEMFFASCGCVPHQASQRRVMRLTRLFDAETVRNAVVQLARWHPMLRARFTQSQTDEGTSKWQQRIAQHSPTVFAFLTIHVSSTRDIPHIVAEMQSSLHIEQGPIFTAALIYLASEQYVALVAHCLVVDEVSWAILSRDLDAMLQGQSPAVEPKTALSYERWCQSQQSRDRKGLLALVQAQRGEVPRGENSRRVSQMHFTLDKQVSAALVGNCNDVFRTVPIDIFHAALLVSYIRSFANATVPVILLERSDRQIQTKEASQTVGWLSKINQVSIDIDNEIDIVEAVRRAKDARLCTEATTLPRVAAEEDIEDRTVKPLTVLFRHDPHELYTPGQEGAVMLDRQLSIEKDTAIQVAACQPLASVDITVSCVQGCVQFTLQYQHQAMAFPEVQRWMQHYEQTLRDAVTQLTSMQTGYTLSDIALPSATYGNLQEVLRCSPMQQGILLSQARNPEFYRVQSFWKAHPPSNLPPGMLLARFRTAWNKVIARHAILRTIMVESRVHPGSFDQVVLKEAPPRIDGICLPRGDPIPVLRERSRLCDLPTDMPAHHLTICITTKEVYLGLTISHALIDAQSINIIMRDVGIAYDDKLPPQAPSYGKYIHYIQQLDLERSITYWTQYLDGVNPSLLPSLDYRRQVGEQQAPELKSLSLEVEAAPRLQQVCSKHGITISNLFQLAWGLTLHCYTGLDDICFGYLAAGRDIPLEELDDAVGPYVNMLICRIQLAGSETLSQLLQKNLTDFIDSSSSQHTPLGRILQSLSLSGPLFNTIISMRPPSHEVQKTSSLAIKPVWELDPTEFDLAINVDVSCDSVQVTMNYWSTTCSDEQAANLASTLHRSLSSILETPHLTPAQLDLFSDDCYAQLQELNAQSPERVEDSATDLIASHIRSQPGAAAVCAWDGKFTYGELGCLALQLATQLAAQGAGPEVFVPILFKKSRWAIVAILAVMQAGAAFVLLDPSHPIARLREICQQVHPPIVLCSVEHQEAAAELGDHLLVLGDGIEAPWHTSSNKLGPLEPSQPSHALYAVFTSGTTGKPKGVVVEHATFCSSAMAHGTLFALRPSSRVLQFSSFAFDVSICEILTTLCFGGCVCVPSEDERLNDLAGAISRLGANTAHFTASVLRLLLPEQVPSLEMVVATGEAMSAADVDQWANHVRLMCAYGPAECCIYTHVQSQIDRQADPRNIGYPTTGLAWLVDPKDHDRLAPLGSAGELVIEGPLVARGYLNHAGEPGEGFISEPRWRSRFSAGRHGAFYKTGDLARYGPKGSLRFIGRKDTQVKINGQRLELAEVEYNLQQAVSVVSDRPLDVLVDIVSFGNLASDPTLTAFVASRMMPCDYATVSMADLAKEVSSLVPSLRAHLHKLLPQYMIPRMYITLDKFPLGKTGKADRRRLREEACKACRKGVHAEIPGTVTVKRPPHNDAERKIQALVSRILGLPVNQVGLDDNFFLLGGDSMAAMKLVAAARSVGMMLSVKGVLQQPRLVDLVQGQGQHLQLPGSGDEGAAQPCHPLPGSESNEVGDSMRDTIASQMVFDASLIQDVLPTTEFQAETVCTWPATYFLITMHGCLDPRRLRVATQMLLDRHEILRTVFVRQETTDHIVQVVLQPIPVPFFEFPCDSEDLSSACELVCSMDSARGLPLGYLATQFTLFSQSANPKYHILAVRLSHAQYDGYCMPLLYRDLARLYGDDTHPLPPVTQYAAYIRHLTRAEKSKARQFWSHTLYASRVPTRLDELSLGAPAESLMPGSLIELTTNMAMPTPHNGITVASLMKSAAALILMSLCQTTDVVFCQVVSGRNVPLPGIETIVGVCANIVPVRVRARPRCTVQSFLGAVQEQHIEALDHEFLGLQEIRRYCTEWPMVSPFGCLIQHQSLDLSPEFSLSAKVECTTRVFGGAFERSYLHLVTIPRDNQLTVQLFAPPGLLDEPHCQRLLDRFCETALWLSSHPDRMVDEWDASI
ncbi:putative nonribosomal peptide synthase [Aspergillus fischeri NRRL 181]|uniref:Nonribosomal peptide synthase, putative n=1 Tax=Neosartorya fischeri (strain ATCC 1020 / DSM 3700 / CBS 544.65 / FGSC A1164 / JCM 1740 / NRRL 181 / WB 181) TaxID=331117 RepID=A1DNT2_NEOFI|nr:nonribosomal peptide synthase, putative [Aspergillus fischeri NRRL 181]EAW16453.1 nonribosomal peptide synthase, putative [Aspergillus fischeri NRRL 181]